MIAPMPWRTPANAVPRRWLGVGLFAVFALALGLRLYGVGRILTVDEPQWIFRSQSFYRALERGDPGGTFQGTHPGVVPMLLIGGGIKAQELLTGTRLQSPRIGAFGMSAKLPVAVATAAGITLASALVVSLFGLRTGLAAGVLLGANPYFLGHSQLAHVDALLSVLFLLSVLGALLYAQRRETRWLLFSALFGGLALLTKLPAVVLVPLVPAALFLERLRGKTVARASLVWWGTAGALFFLLWPSLWLNVLPNIRYFQRDIETVATAPHRGEAAEAEQRARAFYARALVARTSPAILALAIAGTIFAWRRGRGRETLVVIVASGGLALLLTLVEKKADRYLLPSLLLLDVLAAVALGALLSTRRFLRALASLVVGGTVLQAALLAPYAVAYESPLAWKEEPTQSGWGEGLEAAAAILNQHPLGPPLFVPSWYPRVFHEFFRGTTMSLSSRDDHRVSHVVLYRNMRGRAADSGASEILREFEGRKPVAVVRIFEREMAWIYQTGTPSIYTEHVGELVAPAAASTPGSAVEVGTFLSAPSGPLRGVRVAFSTFSSRANTARVFVHVREDADGPDLRRVVLRAADLEDRAWRVVPLDPPLENLEGKRVYVAVTSPDGWPGNAVTVRFQPTDFREAEAVILRTPLGASDSRAAHRRSGDAAIELL